jgi:hypothetical protein
MKITLCDKVLNGDVPSFQFEDKDKAIDFIYDWLKTKDFKESVFVCFANWRNLPIELLRDEQNSILVSHVWDDITDMVESYLDVESFDEMDFSIFEFESYQEAFRYCIDLRESF